jgi:2'-5' RNA ligase
MRSGQRVQATLLLRDLPSVESLRAELDPRMAALIPAHVTVVYDDEAPDPDLLADGLRDAGREAPPIELRLATVAAFEPPDEGLYVATKASDGLARLRVAVLRPPFMVTRSGFWPHVTVLNPRSVEACEEDWRSLIGREVGVSVTVSEVALVEFRDGRWLVREAIGLAGR